MRELYHCAAVTEDTYANTRAAGSAVRDGTLKTLCGLPTQRSWDFPNDFIRFAHATNLHDACPHCLNHPDLPLLALGDL